MQLRPPSIAVIETRLPSKARLAFLQPHRRDLVPAILFVAFGAKTQPAASWATTTGFLTSNVWTKIADAEAAGLVSLSVGDRRLLRPGQQFGPALGRRRDLLLDPGHDD